MVANGPGKTTRWGGSSVRAIRGSASNASSILFHCVVPRRFMARSKGRGVMVTCTGRGAVPLLHSMLGQGSYTELGLGLGPLQEGPLWLYTAATVHHSCTESPLV